MATRPRKHWQDEAADEVLNWLATEPKLTAEALRDHGRPPLAARISEADKLDYYARNWWNPDGSPNTDYRTKLYQRSPEGYMQVFAALEQKKPLPGAQVPNVWADEIPEASPEEAD